VISGLGATPSPRPLAADVLEELRNSHREFHELGEDLK